MKLAPARQAALRFLAALELDLDGGGAEADWDALQERWLADPLLADPRDRRLFRQLTAGVVRLRGRLDARLRRLTGRESLDPVPRDALRLALYQLEHMDRLPAHAVIGESVEWVKRRRPRLAAWTNAQLRNWQRGGVPGEEPSAADDWEAHAEAVHSIPGWLATRWRDEHGDARALAFMAAVGAAPAYCFRWNALREGREALLDALREAGAEVEPLDGAPLGFRVRGAWPAALREALEDGRVSVQDASSQRIAPLLDARDGAQAPGDYADLCAAPGGKCCHLAERGGDRREVVALDIDAGRLGKVLANAERLGLVRLRAECADLRVAAPRPLDGVLLDAPCSALGTLALNPDARWRRRPEEIPRLAALQRELLVAAAAWVRPGGRLLYAVCTFTPEETVRQREGFLAARPDFAPEPFGADELPAALRSAGGDYLVLPDVEDGSGMYAFRCRRRETPAEGEKRRMKMRGLTRFTLSVLGMAAFVLLGIWVANRWILPHHVGSGTAFAMPLLEGSSKEEVYALCARRGLILSERPAEFDASLPSGYLLRQHPPAGTQVKSGRRVTVTFSAGPRMVVVPELHGQTERQARLSLEDLGLVPGDLLRCPGDTPAGDVLSSRPGPGARVPLGGSVALLLSTGGGAGAGGYLMPDLTQRDLDAALALLADSGLERPELRYRSALGARPGDILSQSPAAGTRVEGGGTLSWWSHLDRNRVGVAPSLLGGDLARLADEVRDVETAGADLLHLDVMDGHFVPNLTFGPEVIAAVAKVARLPLDCHLMIESPLASAASYAEAGCHGLTLHLETLSDPVRAVDALHALGVLAGLSVRPGTPLPPAGPLWERLDLLLVMSVEPGYCGQAFQPAAVEKVEAAAALRREAGLDFAISVDGGVGPAQAGLLRRAGADVLVAASAVMGKPDRAAAVAALREAAASK